MRVILCVKCVSSTNLLDHLDMTNRDACFGLQCFLLWFIMLSALVYNAFCFVLNCDGYKLTRIVYFIKITFWPN